MDKSKVQKNAEVSKNAEMDAKTGNERSVLARIGGVVLVAVAISAIIGWIVLKIRGWKNLFETVRQAEEGTFIGDHTALLFVLIAIGFIISIILVIAHFSNKK